jgi:hypothetical protein
MRGDASRAEIDRLRDLLLVRVAGDGRPDADQGESRRPPRRPRTSTSWSLSSTPGRRSRSDVTRSLAAWVIPLVCLADPLVSVREDYA